MKLTSVVSTLAVALCAVSAALCAEQFTDADLDRMTTPEQRRALAAAVLAARAKVDMEQARPVERRWNPTNSYAPSHVACPPMPKGNQYVGLVRNASDHQLSPQEQDYLNRHRQQTQNGWAQWLNQVGLGNALPGGTKQFLSKNQPRTGIAISGGGYRAMLHGLGVVQGFDSRNETAKQRGVGGFLQLTDYVAGLSGGSWATGSMAMNNWPTTQEQLQHFYNLDSNLVIPSNDKISFYHDLLKDVSAKKKANYPTAITDYWGRALSYHLLNGQMYPEQGQGAVFSDIINVTNFKEAKYPFPVVISIGRHPGERMIDSNATYFEFTPYEFGSWQPNLESFMPVGSLGSQLQNGQPSAKDKTCVAGYENFGWVVGSSSTLFNEAYLKTLNSSKVLKVVAKPILGDIEKDDNDVAQVPNSFKGYDGDKSEFANEDFIDLVDGGEANQNVPFEPLIQPARKLDMVVAVDASSDISSWPNGSSLIQTTQRAKQPKFSHIQFANVPSANTFVNRGLNTRPTFFGCQLNKDSILNYDEKTTPAPLIVYMPNYPYSGWGNEDTYKLSYKPEEQQSMVQNSMDVATMGGQMQDWPQCFACASLMRPLQRSKAQIPSECQKCYQKYCWDGQFDDQPPKAQYKPPMGPPPFVTSQGAQQVEPPSTGPTAAAKAGAAPGVRPATSAVSLVAAAALSLLVVFA